MKMTGYTFWTHSIYFITILPYWKYIFKIFVIDNDWQLLQNAYPL